MSNDKMSRRFRERRLEEDLTQQQMAFRFNQSRENIAKMESGERKINPHTAQTFTKEFKDPWLALEAANEYIGWGIERMDGPAADLHRSSVYIKAEEELNEALQAMQKVDVTKHPAFTQGFEIKDIQDSVKEHIDVVRASLTYIATACEEYGLNWNECWDGHYKKMQSRGYVKS